MGVGGCVLGYADPEVDQAVKEAIDCGVHVHAERARGGGTRRAPVRASPLGRGWCAMPGPAARPCRWRFEDCPRAYAGRDKVAFCGYHGWTDWYLAANLGEDRCARRPADVRAGADRRASRAARNRVPFPLQPDRSTQGDRRCEPEQLGCHRDGAAAWTGAIARVPGGSAGHRERKSARSWFSTRSPPVSE